MQAAPANSPKTKPTSMDPAINFKFYYPSLFPGIGLPEATYKDWINYEKYAQPISWGAGLSFCSIVLICLTKIHYR